MLMLCINIGERQDYKTSELLPGKVNVQLHAVIIFTILKTFSKCQLCRMLCILEWLQPYGGSGNYPNVSNMDWCLSAPAWHV